MPIKTNKKTAIVSKIPVQSNSIELQFLKDSVDKFLKINQQLDLRLYPTLGIAALVFIMSLAGILTDGQKGVTGFITMAAGALFSTLLSGYSFKQFDQRNSYGYVLLNGLSDLTAKDFRIVLTELLNDEAKYFAFSHWQMGYLFRLSETKRKFQEAAITLLVMSFMIGVILVLVMP